MVAMTVFSRFPFLFVCFFYYFSVSFPFTFLLPSSTQSCYFVELVGGACVSFFFSFLVSLYSIHPMAAQRASHKAVWTI